MDTFLLHPNRVVVLFSSLEAKQRFKEEFGTWLIAYETMTFVQLSFDSPVFDTEEKKAGFVELIRKEGFEVARLVIE